MRPPTTHKRVNDGQTQSAASLDSRGYRGTIPARFAQMRRDLGTNTGKLHLDGAKRAGVVSKPRSKPPQWFYWARVFAFVFPMNAVPTLVKGLRGTAQPCRVPDNEPQPEGAVLAPPDWMTDAQKAIWQETVDSAPATLLRRVDTGLVLQYVVATDLYLRAARDVTEHGYELAGARGRRFVSPAVVVMNAQAVAMRQCIQEMGFSPASRARISLDDASASADTEHWGQIAMNY